MRRISVECYAGGRADERPRRVTIDGRWHVIARLLSESVEQSPDGQQRTQHYEVLTENGTVLNVARTSDGEWYLVAEMPFS